MSYFLFQSRPIIKALLSVVLLSSCGQSQTTQQTYQGYVEGDYQFLASPYGGFLEHLNVERGARVNANALLFKVNDELARHELNEAQAQWQSLQDKVTNLNLPRRKPEIMAMQAQLKAMQANLQLSDQQLQRALNLFKKGSLPQAELDKAKATRDGDAARVTSAQEQWLSAKNSLGRSPEIKSADADLKAAEARLKQKQWQVDNTAIFAPVAGQVTETYFLPGEWVPAGQPIVSFLPDERRRIRFFVPETELTKLTLGQEITANCDGCLTAVKAKIVYIATFAEYSPPIIYSQDARAKLVFQVEAIPTIEVAPSLHPGLPMDVQLAGAL
ncbi:MAG: HlyD family efflux transporter periplasmic adaptor subunit [Methylococcaceae bacterium]|jgi:HlyD family secretion protein